MLNHGELEVVRAVLLTFCKVSITGGGRVWEDKIISWVIIRSDLKTCNCVGPTKGTLGPSSGLKLLD